MPNPNPAQPILPGGVTSQWWVVISSGSDKATVIESKTKPTGYATVLGPFPTKKDAEKLAEEKSSTIQKSAVGGLSGLDSIGATLQAFYADLTDWKLWRSLGWIILGVALVISGLYLWFRTSGTYSKLEGEFTSAVGKVA